MAIRFLFMAILALVVSGCATTSTTSATGQLQTQMAEMQQRMEDQEKEIIDLKYEVKEMSGRIVEEDESYATTDASAAVKPAAVKAPEVKSFDIIRVAVSGRELQKALQAAGVYTGKIDGKIGAMTRAAIVDFQKGHGLKADGVVGQKTWNELKAYLEAPAAEPAVSE